MRRLQKMKTDSIVKGLIASSIVLFSVAAEAWTVSEPVVDSSLDKQVEHFSIAPSSTSETKVLSLPPQHKIAQFEKREAQLTIEEEASSDYRQALKCRDNGEFLQAEKYLQTALMQMPTHHAARVELATLYLKRNQLEETEMLMSEGLRLDE